MINAAVFRILKKTAYCADMVTYMIKTKANEDLIKEIDAGIKKEVSVSCCVSKHICSICGCDVKEKTCNHRKGIIYGNKKCAVILDCPTDAYEWSFVAVPAQVNAGVTKRYSDIESESETVLVSKSELDCLKARVDEKAREVEEVREYLKNEVVRLCFLSCPSMASQTVVRLAEGMEFDELAQMKSNLEKSVRASVAPQTMLLSNQDKQNNRQFKL